MNPSSFNAWKLVSLSPLPIWALRLSAGAAALFFVLEPGIRNLQVARMKNRVAVLVDRSASMSFPATPGGKTRTEVVAEYLKSVEPQWSALQDRFTMEVYG